MNTFRDFESRLEFVENLGYYHYDSGRTDLDFWGIGSVDLTNCQETTDIQSNIKEVFETWNDQSINQIENSLTNDPRQKEIMHGQTYDKLRAGFKRDTPMYRVKNAVKNSVLYELAESLGLEYPLARYHVQFPGETTLFHTDIFSPAHEFLPDVVRDLPDEKIGHDNNVRRILIALEDWQWGHVFTFGKSAWINWNKGDIVYWPFGVPHSSANTGYNPRISASITGLASEKFHNIVNQYNANNS